MVKGYIWEDAFSSFWQEERPHSFRANGALKFLTGQWKQNFNCFETGGFKSKDRKRIKMIFHLLSPGVIIQFVTVTLGGEEKNINSFHLSELYKIRPLKVWGCQKGCDAVQYPWLAILFLLSAPSSFQLVHESLGNIHLPAHPAPCDAQLVIWFLKKHQSTQWSFKTTRGGESSL